MSQSERKLGGIFRLIRNIKLEEESPKQTSNEPTIQAESQSKIPEFSPFWRTNLSRREIVSWILLPSIPLTPLVITAWNVDIRWDGKPTIPPSPTVIVRPTPTATVTARPTTTTSLIVIPNPIPTPDNPPQKEILINSQ